MSDTETFLIILQDKANGFVQAFVHQCAYDELSSLNHECWDLHVYLLVPDPAPTWTQYGTQLTHVIDFHSIHAAEAHTKHAAWLLSRLPVPQRKLELERIKRVLEAELIEVTPLSTAEVKKLSRYGEQPDFEPLTESRTQSNPYVDPDYQDFTDGTQTDFEEKSTD